jgi:hypothetical protein
VAKLKKLHAKWTKKAPVRRSGSGSAARPGRTAARAGSRKTRG